MTRPTSSRGPPPRSPPPANPQQQGHISGPVADHEDLPRPHHRVLHAPRGALRHRTAEAHRRPTRDFAPSHAPSPCSATLSDPTARTPSATRPAPTSPCTPLSLHSPRHASAPSHGVTAPRPRPLPAPQVPLHRRRHPLFSARNHVPVHRTRCRTPVGNLLPDALYAHHTAASPAPPRQKTPS